MSKRVAPVPFITLTLDPLAQVPLHRQLYDGLREAILKKRLAEGAQLPPTRMLAVDLGISRTTVVTAFEQLLAEGYLEARVGDGTYVARVLPEELLHAQSDARHAPSQTDKGRAPSQRGKLLACTPVTNNHNRIPGAFQPGLPALDAIPFKIWEQLAARHYGKPSRELLAYGNPAGYRPLREVIATYLSTLRAVQCTAEQVLVVSGSQQALDIAARVLLDPGDAVWFEDPGYVGARGALIGSGASVVPVPVDEEGLNVAAGEALCADARMVYVTPSHQYPLGVVMSLKRRLALLAWAHRTGAWILEDDYSSEYRYHGRPLASLQGLDTHGQVVYIGTFSKVLFPALRLGYLVVPPDLVNTFSNAHALIARHTPLLEQAILADFIAEGHFARHIRHMRALYARRQQVLVEAAQQELTGLLDVSAHEAGMHLVGWLPDGADDREIAQRIATVGLSAPALSEFGLSTNLRPGLLLGYAGVDEEEIRQGVRRLAKVLAIRDTHSCEK
jgi:GntR family transcriptional regulator/MocR family aminotransferase